MKKIIREAVIYNYNERGKAFIDELKKYFETRPSIHLHDLAKMADKYDIEVVDYNTFYDELPDLWKKGQIPPRKSNVFGLANPNNKKARLVFGDITIPKSLFGTIKIIVAHEFVHVGQSERMAPDQIYIPPRTVFDKKIYFSNFREIMAWSRTIVDEIMDVYHPKTLEEAMKNLPKGNYYNSIRNAVKDDREVWNKYLNHIYSYFKKEFEPDEPVDEKSELSELRKKIRQIIKENKKIKVNHAYFQKLLDMSRTDISNRNFIQGVLNSIREAGGMATERQYAVLKRFETGDKRPYSSKN